MLQGIVSFDLEVQYLSILRPPPRLLCRLFLLYRSPCPLHVFPVCPQFKAWRRIYCWMLFEAPAKAPVLSESPEVWNVSSWVKSVTDLFQSQWVKVWIKGFLYFLFCVSLMCSEFWLLVEHFSIFLLFAFMGFSWGSDLEWFLMFSTDCTTWIPHQLKLPTRILASCQIPHFLSSYPCPLVGIP